jgi:putative ABC transport system permease protein
MSQPPIAERLFRALLRVFPAEFRGDYGDQMTDDFRDQHAEAAMRNRRTVRWRLWTRTIVDVLNRAPREHLDILRRDAAYAVRQLERRPLISAGAIVTFAVGLGLNTAVFGLASTILWRSLPLPASQSLVAIHEISADPSNPGTSVSAANFADWEARSRALDAIALVGWTTQTLLDAGDPELLVGARVSRAFFRVVAVQPQRGRVFTDADYAPLEATAAGPITNRVTIEPDVAIITHDLWLQRFGGRDDVVGRTVRFGKTSVEIVGVLPRGFEFPGSEQATFWQPMAPDGTARRARYLSAFGRLAAGVTLPQAQAEFDTISTELAERYPRANKDFRARLLSLRDEVARSARSYLWLLLGAAGSVLLIACASIGNLLLAQASGRRLEFATRSALGATRAHLVRQMLTESLLIAVIGGAMALLLATWALPVLTKLVPQDIPRLTEIRIDGMVVAFTTVASIGVGLMCGVLASIAARSAAGPIRHGIGADANGPARRFRLGLTVVQVGLALSLAIGTGLLTRTLQAVAALKLGFNPSNVLSVGLTATGPRYSEPGVKAQFESELETRVRALPGVVAAGIGSKPLGSGGVASMFTIEAKPDQAVDASVDVVGPGYLEALGARLAAGRFVDAGDSAGRPLVAVVNRAAADAWWPDANPLGQAAIRDEHRLQVVGIVENVRRGQLEADPSPTVYLSAAQTTNVSINNLLVRTSDDARAVLPAIREIMRSMDREQALARITTLEESLSQATAPRRNLLWLVAFFSGMALLLAVIGIYGVVSESVAQRIPEIGVRMALGAGKANVMALIARQGLWLIVGGTLIGMAIAVIFNRMMTAFVFGVATTDAVTYAIACLCTAAATLTACLLPAGRAARIDPVIALRHE